MIILKKDDKEIRSLIICAVGGVTTIHKNSIVQLEEYLFICSSDQLFKIEIPSLKILWNKRLDPATCFGFHQFQDDLIIHGELSITKINKEGERLWEFGGRDIFVREKGESFEIKDNTIDLIDWGDWKYVLDENGKELSSLQLEQLEKEKPLKISKENLRAHIKEAIPNLIEVANDCCWNEISDNYAFLVSEIINSEDNFNIQRIKRREENEQRLTIDFNTAVEELLKIYDDLHDINLYICKAERYRTIIEIRYFRKSALNSELKNEKLLSNPPMLHCKVPMPPYLKNESEKFDINWELGGFRDSWKTYWWRRKHRKSRRQ